MVNFDIARAPPRCAMCGRFRCAAVRILISLVQPFQRFARVGALCACDNLLQEASLILFDVRGFLMLMFKEDIPSSVD